jgi:hypothetical protein
MKSLARVTSCAGLKSRAGQGLHGFVNEIRPGLPLAGHRALVRRGPIAAGV